MLVLRPSTSRRPLPPTAHFYQHRTFPEARSQAPLLFKVHTNVLQSQAAQVLVLGTEADPQLSREDTLPNNVPAARQTAPGAETSLVLRGMEEEPSKPGMGRAGLALTSPVLPNLTAHPC